MAENASSLELLIERKNKMRRQAYDARAAQENKDEVSSRACARFVALEACKKAKVVMWYMECRTETRTRRALAEAIKDLDKRVIVPYCTVDEAGDNKLGLWHLESFDELVVGKWKILEPPRERWAEVAKNAKAEELDVVLVPGVGFDRNGGRMGNGQGYYDRLLEKVRPDCLLAALCYESQLFDEIQMSSHDVFMDLVITENAVYEGKGRN